LLSYSASPCIHADKSERTTQECSCALNSFEHHFHPLEYLRTQCMQQDHITLYQSQSQRQTGNQTFRFEACSCHHNEKEFRFGKVFLAKAVDA